MASSNIARLGVVLGIDTASFKADVDKAIAENVKLKNEIKRNSEAAAKEIAALTYATKDYGKEITKVEQIEREIAAGRFQNAAPQLLQELRNRASAYDAIATSSKKAMGGMTSQQQLQLTYQTTDLITQIASGQNAMIALLQQGGQLKDSMGGLGNMFRMLAGLITPSVVAIGALGTALGAVGYAIYAADKELDALKDSLTLTGGYTKDVGERFFTMSRILSSDLHVSVGAAKDVLMALIESGKFTGMTFDSVSKTILLFSQVTGLSATEAAKALIPSLDGTASSAKRMNDQYHFLTLAQYKQIEALEKQGKIQEAIVLQSSALQQSLESQRRELGVLESAWKGVWEWSSKAWDSMLGNFRAPTVVEELAIVSEEIYKFQKQLGSDNAFARENAKDKLPQFVARYTKLAQEYLGTLALVASKEAEATKISKYDKAGGLSKELALADEFEKLKMQNKIANDKLTLNEEERITLESNMKIFEAQQAMAKKNRDEQYVFAAQNKQIYLEQVKSILDEEEQLRSKAREKAYLDDPYNKGFISKLKEHADYEKQIANNYDKASASAYELAEAENKSLEYEQAKADLQIRNLGLSEKQIAIEQTRLEYIKKQSDIRDRTDLRQSDKEALQKMLEDQYNQRVSIIETQNQYKVLEDMTTSVYKNMGDAIDKFVRTGKFQFKDFARSVIQDLIAIKMKAQITEITGGSDGIGGFIKSIFGGGGGGGGMTGTQNSMLAASWNAPAADGGDLAANKIGLVGERGPELFVPKTAGTIIPNHQLAGMGGQTINYNGTYIANMSAIDTQSGTQFLAKNKNTIWAAYQSANRGVPVSR